MRRIGGLRHDPRGGTEICAHIRENCGQRALDAWKRSPAHNAILLSSRIDTIGIGFDDNEGRFWTVRGRNRGVERSFERTVERSVAEDGTRTVERSSERSVERSSERGSVTVSEPSSSEQQQQQGRRILFPRLYRLLN